MPFIAVCEWTHYYLVRVTYIRITTFQVHKLLVTHMRAGRLTGQLRGTFTVAGDLVSRVLVRSSEYRLLGWRRTCGTVPKFLLITSWDDLLLKSNDCLKIQEREIYIYSHFQQTILFSEIMIDRAVSRSGFNRYPCCSYTKFDQHLGAEFIVLVVKLVHTFLHLQ